LIERPLGRLLALNVYGVVPPVTAIPPLYAVSTVSPGSDVVVIDSVLGTAAAAIVMLRFAVTDCDVGCVESLTSTETVRVPIALCAGVPVITPVELPIAKPLGKLLAP
jgi:hypothetical protein